MANITSEDLGQPPAQTLPFTFLQSYDFQGISQAQIVPNLGTILNRGEVLGYGVLQPADTQALSNITRPYSRGSILGALIHSYLQSTIAPRNSRSQFATLKT